MSDQNPNEWDGFIVDMMGDVRRLDYVERFASIPVTLKETVSSHSFWVVLYSLGIHRKLDGKPELVGPVAAYAATHDLAECLTGDVVRTFKYSTPELKSAIDSAEDSIVNLLPHSVRDLMSLGCDLAGNAEEWKYVKGVVKCADFMSLFAYINREFNRGNREITPFVGRMVRDLQAESERAEKYEDARLHPLAGLYRVMVERAFDLVEAKIT